LHLVIADVLALFEKTGRPIFTHRLFRNLLRRRERFGGFQRDALDILLSARLALPKPLNSAHLNRCYLSAALCCNDFGVCVGLCFRSKAVWPDRDVHNVPHSVSQLLSCAAKALRKSRKKWRTCH